MNLPDTNVWLALAFEAHIHHAAAKLWLAGIGEEPVFFCRATQQGFLRLATNPKAFPADAVSLIAAWQLYDRVLSDPRFAFLEEPPAMETLWRGFTQYKSFSPQIWSDAYLAAFAEQSQLRLVTFDKGFTQYKLTRCTILA